MKKYNIFLCKEGEIYIIYMVFCYRNNVAPQVQLRTLQAWMNIKAWVFKNGIYIIYMGFCRAISNSIAPQPRHFFFVLGLRPRTKKKMPRFRGYTVGYSPPKPHIYITYTSISMNVNCRVKNAKALQNSIHQQLIIP